MLAYCGTHLQADLKRSSDPLPVSTTSQPTPDLHWGRRMGVIWRRASSAGQSRIAVVQIEGWANWHLQAGHLVLRSDFAWARRGSTITSLASSGVQASANRKSGARCSWVSAFMQDF